ncbi:threonine ammonia-lyase IlvA [Lactococcus hircilactis]|uniref:L-threonine dehydratase n=1 Tax=Lactococcus hircilactis TaxID=1494462 RepID=A0A7X2D181_9LACT|nr:threonine ammonia-lyase IlvA [Lactococcus hircilactis]MQW40251.1 threonine ammonia-lyase IlvA [Lactococcus hircilactis]
MLSVNDVKKAYEVLKPVVFKTALTYDKYLSEKYHANIYLKHENEQRVRSFKLRGAYYAISQLTKEERKNGVVCASAGNHAQGVAYAANELQIQATIFMPVTTPNQKISQVRFFGGSHVQIELIGDTFDEAAKAAKNFSITHQKTFVDPFDDENVMAGQGTVALEIFDQAEKEGIKFDKMLVQIGGGGLISGMATYSLATHPEVEVIGIEAAGAMSMRAAYNSGRPVTLNHIDKFADGIAVATAGQKTFATIKDKVERLLSVDEGLISETILELYSKVGLVAEPAGAAAVAALEVIKDEIVGQTIVCLISGGNNDISRMQEIEERTQIYQGVKHYFVVNFPQRPGALRQFVNEILGPNDDITRFEYIKRASKGKGPCLIGILLSDKQDYDALLERITQFDPNYVNLHGNESLYNLLV